MTRPSDSCRDGSGNDAHHDEHPPQNHTARKGLRQDGLLQRPDAMSYLTRLLGSLLAGTRRQEKSAQLLAERLLARFKRLDRLAEASDQDLLEVAGMTPTLLHRLKLATEFREALNNSYQSRTRQLATPEDVFRLLAPKLRSLHHEVFLALVVDNQLHQVQEFSVTEQRTNRCPVDVRDLFLKLLQTDARRVLFVHNHTDINPNPSKTDESLTERLVRAAHPLDIEVLDHVIISRRAYYSFYDNHKLPSLESFWLPPGQVRVESVMSPTAPEALIYGQRDAPSVNPALICLHDF